MAIFSRPLLTFKSTLRIPSCNSIAIDFLKANLRDFYANKDQKKTLLNIDTHRKSDKLVEWDKKGNKRNQQRQPLRKQKIMIVGGRGL